MRLRDIPKLLFFGLFIRPVVLIVLGLNVRGRSNLPVDGPAILVANHNSHLDTMVLMSLFPLSTLLKIRPAAAEDYFFKSGWLMRWFSTYCIGSIAVARKREAGSKRGALDEVQAALAENNIIIFFPEGTRGEPEQMSTFKSGIAKLAEKFPDVPIVPFFLHGLAKALPKGEALLVPFILDVFVGEAMKWNGSSGEFVRQLEERVRNLSAEANFPVWE